jgi:putative transposase
LNKYGFIADYASAFEVKLMCRVLEVSVSGYYAWRVRRPSRREKANAGLLSEIRAIHSHSRRTYGSPRIHAALAQRGIACNHKRVERLMRLDGLRGWERRTKRPSTTQSQHDYPIAANLLNRDFSATAPNQKWLADISYIDTQEGYLYLASLEDVFSRRIVGWAMADSLETSLVERALHMALTHRQPQTGLLHHSDRGSQYASHDYQRLLAQRQMTVSMSRTGNCYDNAMKESFFATLKAECASQPFATRAAAHLAIFEFIEVWYNRQRLHSSLGYLSPQQFENRFAQPLL